MNKFQKLGFFLVRLVCVALTVWSAIRFAGLVFAFYATNGFKFGGAWMPFASALIPFLIAVGLHFLAPRIVAHIAHDLHD